MGSRTAARRTFARNYEQHLADKCPESGPVQVDEEISARIHELKSAEEHIEVATRATEFLYRRAHASHLRCEENKRQIRSEGAIPYLCELLSAKFREARYQACSALSELAFRDERNSFLIVSVPGALDGIMQLMVASDMQEDAALVLSNCAAFSEDAVATMVEYPGLVAALKVVATSAEPDARGIAIGAINCLSRFSFATETLISENVVGEALLPMLAACGEEEELDGVALRAAMAVANLTGLTRENFGSAKQYTAAVTTAVSILEGALAGKSWRGIAFSAYSILFPLRNLAAREENREALVACGLLELVAVVIREWREVGQNSGETLGLAVEVGLLLAGQCGWQQRMREAGVMPLLALVAAQSAGEPPHAAELAAELLEVLEQGHVAVFMAQHARLGADSPLALLDEHVASIILAFTIGGRAAQPLGPLVA